MHSRKILCCICFFIVVTLAVWIFLNPYATLQTVQKMPYILTSVNNFFSIIGLSYRFSFSDVASTTRFLQYLLFGIFTTFTAKLFSKSIFKNISTPLFVGLFMAVAEIYCKFLQYLNVNISMVVSSFISFCVGVSICLIFTKKKTFLKKSYKFSKFKI